MKTDKLFYGAAYYDEYMPYDRIDEDFRLMTEAGMNTIRIAESTWSTWEPQDGVFDFTHLHHMLDAANKYHIQVIVGTPTYAIPAWLAKKHPEILAETHWGKEKYGRRQNMDITNPDYLFHAERIIRKLLEECADHPCVIGFQIDNETSPYDTCAPHVQAAFVDYLKEQFPNIDDFNQEFGLNYWSNRIASWEDFPDVRGTINQSLDAEFKKFQRGLVTFFHNWQISIIREYKKPHQFITHNFDFGWNGCMHGMKLDVNQFDCAKEMDVAGCDIYHKSAAELNGQEITLGGAIARSLKQGNYLVLETEAQGNPGWLPYPGQLRLQAFSHIACGANGVSYWHWHSLHNAIETYWKGVLSHNLKPGAAYYECQTIGKDFARLGDRIGNLSKKCKVAIMTSNNSLVGLDEFEYIEKLKYNDILTWIAYSLHRLNVEFDIVPDNAPQELLNSYAMLVIPALYSASRETIANLKAFTAQGGHLFMTFKSCFSNEHIKVYAEDQPCGLTDVFGMTYDQFTIASPRLINTAFDADGVQVTDFMELLLPATGTEVWAIYDHPAYKGTAAVTSSVYGNGRATYIGCKFEEAALDRLLTKVCENAGVLDTVLTYPLVRKCGTNAYGNTIIYYMNYSDEPQTIRPEADGTELLSGETITSMDSYTLAPWNFIILEVHS